MVSAGFDPGVGTCKHNHFGSRVIRELWRQSATTTVEREDQTINE